MIKLDINEIKNVSGGYAPEFVANLVKQEVKICVDCLRDHVSELNPQTYDEKVVATAYVAYKDCDNSCHTTKLTGVIGFLVTYIFG